MLRLVRVKREMEDIARDPPTRISCFFENDDDDNMASTVSAQIIGAEGTPYEGGIFKLSIVLPEKYPFVPPSVHFITPIYHPNIDEKGRICLDNLKSAPQGTWKPCLNLRVVLLSIQQLLETPNPDNPLMMDIAKQYSEQREQFEMTARNLTKKNALENFEKKECKRALSDDEESDMKRIKL